jgi:phosphotransferase system HPr (HPr) family protein
MDLADTAVVKNIRGIHARPSSEIANAAKNYESQVKIIHNGVAADAKNVLQIIILELGCNSQVIIETKGRDADIALGRIKELIEHQYSYD